jgi:tetratricopeptide (TPR) repeat protein
LEDLEKAVRLDPKFALAYGYRAFALEAKGQYDRSIKDYEEAIRLTPEEGRYFASYARLLAMCSEEKFRDGKRAITMATRACDLTDWKLPVYLDTLAAAYAEAGQFDQAVRYRSMARKTVGRPANKFEDLKRRIHAKLDERLDFTKVKDFQSNALRKDMRRVIEYLCDIESPLLKRIEWERLIDEMLHETLEFGPSKHPLMDTTFFQRTLP